jgi:hypothetical protein
MLAKVRRSANYCRRRSGARSSRLSQSADGTGAEGPLLTNSRGTIATDWSRDGAFLLYKEASGGSAGLVGTFGRYHRRGEHAADHRYPELETERANSTIRASPRRITKHWAFRE